MSFLNIPTYKMGVDPFRMKRKSQYFVYGLCIGKMDGIMQI